MRHAVYVPVFVLCMTRRVLLFFKLYFCLLLRAGVSAGGEAGTAHTSREKCGWDRHRRRQQPEEVSDAWLLPMVVSGGVAVTVMVIVMDLVMMWLS